MVHELEIALKNANIDFQGVNQETDTDDSLYEIITSNDVSQSEILDILFAASELGLIYVGQQTDIDYEDDTFDANGDQIMQYMNIYYFAIAYKKNSETILNVSNVNFEE